jgi:hypothetical protein
MFHHRRLPALGVLLVFGGVACMIVSLTASLATAQRAVPRNLDQAAPFTPSQGAAPIPTAIEPTAVVNPRDLPAELGVSTSKPKSSGVQYAADNGTPIFGDRDYQGGGGQVRVGPLRFGWR